METCLAGDAKSSRDEQLVFSSFEIGQLFTPSVRPWFFDGRLTTGIILEAKRHCKTVDSDCLGKQTGWGKEGGEGERGGKSRHGHDDQSLYYGCAFGNGIILTVNSFQAIHLVCNQIWSSRGKRTNTTLSPNLQHNDAR